MNGIAWSEEEIRDLTAWYPNVSAPDIVKRINDTHGHNRTLQSVYSMSRKLGLKREPDYFWTEDRKQFMRDFVPGHGEREIADEFENRFGIRLTRQQVKAGKSISGVNSGTFGGRFEKGNESPTKGRPWDEWMPPESQEKSKQGWFQKGNMPHNALSKPIGYERVDQDGYTWVKIAERPTRQDCNDNFRPKHHLAWEQANGKPIPDGFMIVFANHDKQDFSPENLVAVPKSTWAIIVRRQLQYHDAESLMACVMLAKLRNELGSAKKSRRLCKACGNEFNPRYPHQRRCDTCLGRE